MSRIGTSNVLPLSINNVIREDVVVGSFKEFNLMHVVTVMIVIYDSPMDYENKFIARI